jgi:hypothetical protein
VTPYSTCSVIEQCRSIDQVRKYLEILHTFTPLYNDIAHSAWIETKPDNSIQPAWLSHGPLTAIKAVHDTDEHSKYFIENDQDKNTRIQVANA